jgi:hypothetical protein
LYTLFSSVWLAPRSFLTYVTAHGRVSHTPIRAKVQYPGCLHLLTLWVPADPGLLHAYDTYHFRARATCRAAACTRREFWVFICNTLTSLVCLCSEFCCPNIRWKVLGKLMLSLGTWLGFQRDVRLSRVKAQSNVLTALAVMQQTARRARRKHQLPKTFQDQNSCNARSFIMHSLHFYDLVVEWCSPCN